METKDKFSIRIIGIIFNPKEREIIICKKSGSKKWEFIETELINKDSLDKKLKNTIKEKTGYNIKNLGAVFAEKNTEENNIMEIHFLCQIFDGEEKKSDDIEQLKWIKPTHAERYLDTKLPTRLKGYLQGLE